MEEKKSRRAARSSVTINDVAQKAGVSRTAVSFVLNENGKRNKYVSEETRTKVLQAVEELHYQPHLLARSLRTGQSPEIAGITDVPMTFYGMEASETFQRFALQYGYMPTAYYSHNLSDPQRKELYQRIFARRPLGIITTPFHFTKEDVEQARANGVEHILFYSFYPVPIEHTYSLVFPTREIGYLAAQHLLERGYRRLVLIHPEDSVYGIQEYPFQERLAGMRAAISEHLEASTIELEIMGLAFSAEVVSEFVESMLRGREKPTGVYAFNDEYALYLLGALARHGVAVPQQVGVIGTDNLTFGEGTWPPLTSISLDEAHMGKRCADLFHALHQGIPLSEELTSPLHPQLIQRASA